MNGQSYDRWEDVPAEVRHQLAATLPDADKNGVPDLFEDKLAGLPQGAQTFNSAAIMVNGQTISSAADLPPDVQAQLRQALGALGPVLGSMFGTQPTPPAPGAAPAPGAVPPNAPWPLQPGQVMLNGVPTSVGETAEVKKPWWKRLFGG